MSGALRFTRIRVQHVGILGDHAVDLGPLSPGINVVSGPNECGKTSIVKAVRAALFQRHGTGNATVKALQPHGSKAGPTIELGFEIDGVGYELEKRFLKKTTARVRALDGSLSLEGDEADQWLLAELGAREAIKKGASPDDIGMWGLLWVSQDQYATLEPAERMGEHVRGTLAHAIGSLVGNVMGGQHGVPLRDAIDAAFETVWTPKQDRATGKLLAARDAIERLTGEVADLRRKVEDTVRLSSDVEEKERELEGQAEAESALRAELDECARAVLHAEGVEREREASATALREAREAASRASRAVAERAERRAVVARGDETVRAQRTVVDARRATSDRLRAEAEVAARDLAAARSTVDEIGRVVQTQGARLDGMRRRDELGALEAMLAEGVRLDGELRAGREALRRLPDEEALASIQSIDARRQQRSEALMRFATRVSVEAPGRAPEVHLVASRRAVALGELGTVTIDPPREGFTKARESWRESRRALQAALDAAKVASVSEARVLDARRREFEERFAERHAKLAVLAPKGLDALAADADRAERDATAARTARDEATARRDELARLEQQIASVAVGAAERAELEALDAKARALAEVEATGAVRIKLRPLAAVRVQVGVHDTPRLLTAGTELRRAVGAPMTLVIDDRLEVEIDPGTAEGATDGGAAAVERALAIRLSVLGFSTLDEALAQARQRAQDEATRDVLARQLAEQAPDGVAVLAESVQRRERVATELRRRVGEAREHHAAAQALERQAREITVSGEAFAALDELDGRGLADEQRVHRLAGRVVAAEGRVAAAWEGREDLIEAVTVTVDGTRIEIVPGEAAHDTELPGLEHELAARLHVIEATTVDEAIRAHVRWGALRAEVAGSERALARVAPKGVAALEAEVSARRSSDGGVAEEGATRETLELAQRVEQSRLERARAEVDAAVPRERVARQLADEALDAQRRDDAELVRLQAEVGALAALLRAEEEGAGDAALRSADETARAAAEQCQARDNATERAWAEALPDVRRADLARTERLLADQQARAKALREEYVHASGRLEATLPEGHYDQQRERETALEQARVELAREERRARALKLLRETTAGAYDEAQRRLMDPVYKEAMPLLAMIRPGTTFTMDDSSLRLEHVTRDGFEEEFKNLSGGAREQLAVVIRVALARVFARQQRAMPLILDDVLGWTDDRRLRAMINVLERTAQDMQVILLTCHPSRFRGVMGGATFELEKLKQAVATT